LGSGNVTIESTGLPSANTGAVVALNTNGIYANNFTISGQGTANGAIQSFASNATLSGLVTLAGDAMIATRTNAGNGKLFITGGITNGGSNRTLTLNAFSTDTISGNEITISTNSVNLGSGGTLDLGAGIQNGGSGTFNINVGGNTWGTTIVRGTAAAGNSTNTTLNLGAANALGSSSSVLQLGNSTTSLEQITVNLNGNNQTIGGLRSFGSTGSASANGTRTVTSATAATLTIDNSSATNYLYDGVISGSISLLKNGTATQTLAGNNTYTGNTIVAGGTLRLAGNGTLGTSTISISGGTLDMGGKSLTNTFGSLTGGTLSNGTLTNNGGNYDLQSGTVSAVLAGTNGVNKTGNGTVRLTGQNTYQGATTIQSGTLEIASTGAIGNTSRIDVNNSGSILLVTVGDTLNNAPEINLNNGQMSLMGNFSETFGNLTSNGSSRIDLATFSGVLRFGGVGSWGANTQLEIWNWNSGTQNIVFTDNTNLSLYLNQISFYSNLGVFIGTASMQNYTGFGDGTEIIAVPEPETYIIVMVFLLGFGIHQLRLARHGQGLLSRLTFLRCTAQRKPFEGQPPA
jgi:autotransporter-associated beta strand protein